MEETDNIEKKLYDLLKPRFRNPCGDQFNSEILCGKLILSEVQEAACHLFDRIRIFYRVYDTNDITKTWFVVAAVFESPELTKLMSCFSTANEALTLFDSLKKDYCEAN
jgi:hypothetical protein